ncbi:hypothetical protein CspHIS471_0310710 [Cutaneotrichosporon sp. HIS471]|nr:hypothetical protein CspHIS471_0310710 [Cutaneotrichosporon sp. HIS471]
MSDLVESTAPTSQPVLTETSPVSSTTNPVKDTSTATVDLDTYPHILDSILDHASFGTLLALRGASRALRDRADANLVAHVAIVIMHPPFPPGSVGPMASLSTKSFDVDKWRAKLGEVHDYHTTAWPVIQARRDGEYCRIPRNCWMDVPTLGAAVRVLELGELPYSRFVARSETDFLNHFVPHLPHLAVIRTHTWSEENTTDAPCLISDHKDSATAVSYRLSFCDDTAEARYHPVYDTNSRHLIKWRVLPSQPSTGTQFVVFIKEPHSIIKRGLSSKSVARFSRQQSLKVTILPSLSNAFWDRIPCIIVGLEELAPDLGDSPQALLIDELLTLLANYWKPGEDITNSKKVLSEHGHLFVLITRREYIETMGIDAMDLHLRW